MLHFQLYTVYFLIFLFFFLFLKILFVSLLIIQNRCVVSTDLPFRSTPIWPGSLAFQILKGTKIHLLLKVCCLIIYQSQNLNNEILQSQTNLYFNLWALNSSPTRAISVFFYMFFWKFCRFSFHIPKHFVKINGFYPIGPIVRICRSVVGTLQSELFRAGTPTNETHQSHKKTTSFFLG